MRIRFYPEQLKARLGQILRKTSDANVTRAMLIGARMLQADSQRIVPVDTGTLKRSADVRIAPDGGFGAGKGPQVDVVYSTNYAIYVHEMVNVPHNTPANAQAKFLEQPAKENRDEYVEAITKEIL